MKKDNILKVVLKNKELLESKGFSISKSGKKLGYGDYRFDFIMSKYGYDDMYGLSFFLRATNKKAPLDKWGNINHFDKSEIDFTPQDLKTHFKGAWANLRQIYGNQLQLMTLPTYFCALDDAMIEDVILLVLPLSIEYVKTTAK